MKMVTFKLAEIHELENPRTYFDGIEELKRSIASVGLLQPLVVRLMQNAGEQPVLVDGARRLRALKELGLKEVSCIVTDATSADEAQMAANLVRCDLNVLEKARGYATLIKKYPGRYNAKAIQNSFGTPSKIVQVMIKIANTVDPEVDKILAPHVSRVEFDDLVMLGQIPHNLQTAFARRYVKSDMHLWSALHQAFHELSYSDAVETEKLVAAGKAFRVGSRSIYTTDKAVYEEAKKAYEAKRKSEYGSADKEAVAKSEKEKERDRAEKKKAAERREVARNDVARKMPAFLDMGISALDELDALGEELCERHLRSDTAREMLAIFGVKEPKNLQYGQLQKFVWTEIVKKRVKSANSLVRLHAMLTSSGQSSTVENWAQGMKKAGLK